MAIVITGEGDSPGEVITRTHAGQLRREADSPGVALADLLRGKMAFVYESDLEPDRPGWFLAMDREGSATCCWRQASPSAAGSAPPSGSNASQVSGRPQHNTLERKTLC